MPGPYDPTPPVSDGAVTIYNPNPTGDTTSNIYNPWGAPNAPGITGQKDRWVGPWRSRSGGLGPDGAAIPQRTLNVGATIWGNVVPWVFGENRVPAYFGAVAVADGVVRIGLVFAMGEQASIGSLLLGGETVPAEITVRTHVGDGTALSGANTGNILNSTYFSGWSAADNTLWASLCHAAIMFSDTLEIPSLNFTALLGGQRFQDWLGGAAAAHTNPARVAYFIFKSSSWIGDLSSRLDTGAGGTWRRFADWCDDDVSGDPRWEFCGVVAHRKASNALADVLNHGLASRTLGHDGLVRIWASMPPPPITGTWDSVGSSTTINGTGGAALTDLAVGDYGYLEGYWAAHGIRRVVTVTDDDTVVLDAAVNIAAGTRFRRLQHGGIRIRREDWARQPILAGVDAAEVIDAHRVKFVYPVAGGDDERTYPTSGTFVRQTETSLNGCPNAAMALRYAETVYNLAQLTATRYENGVDKSGKAAQLDVGDVFLIDVGNRTLIPVQLHPPRSTMFADNTVGLRLMVAFSGAAYSEGTDTDTTPPGLIPGWNDPPDNVTSVGYTFTYFGATGQLAQYHDDVNSWTTKTNVTITSNDTSGPTGLSSGTADKVVATSVNAVIAGAGTVTRAATPLERAFVFLKAVSAEDAVRISTDNVGERQVLVRDWWRAYFAGGSQAGGSIRIEMFNGAGRPDLHVCGAGSFLTNGDWYSMETMTWTPPADTVGISRVALQYQTESGGTWIEHAAVPVEAGTISWGTAPEAGIPALPATWYDWRLVVVGVNRLWTVFPDPSTTNYAGSTTNREHLGGAKYSQLGSGEVFQVGDPAGGDPDYLEIDENGVVTRARWPIISTTAAALTLNDSHYAVECDCTSNAITLTLPTAVGRKGKAYRITKTDITANVVIIDGDGAETISGSATLVITGQWESAQIMANAAETGWVIQ